MQYGLNPYIRNENHPNSPYYEDPCDFCKKKSCDGCEYYESEDDND